MTLKVQLADDSTGLRTLSTAQLLSTATANAAIVRDANANAQINSIIENFATTATAVGTTTLTVSSPPLQQFTGSTTQTVALPNATTLLNGWQFMVFNRSTGIVTVKDNGGNTIQAMVGSTQAIFTLASNGTANGTWDVSYTGAPAGSVTLRAGNQTISSGVATVAVTFSSSMPNTSYSVTATLVNTTDANPQFQPITITAFSTTGFTAKWNANTDSANYVLNWTAIANQ